MDGKGWQTACVKSYLSQWKNKINDINTKVNEDKDENKSNAEPEPGAPAETTINTVKLTFVCSAPVIAVRLTLIGLLVILLSHS